MFKSFKPFKTFKSFRRKPDASQKLYVALDQSYVSPKDCDDIIKSFRRLSIMISNLIDYLKRTGMRG